MSTIPWSETMDGSPARVRRTLKTLFDEGKFSGKMYDYHAEGPVPPVIDIRFQAGPIQTHGVNGCSIEDVIDVLVDRLAGFQRGPFACEDNEVAMRALMTAKQCLLARTTKRQAQGVEGTSTAHKETPVA